MITYFWRSLKVCFGKAKSFEQMRMHGEGQRFKFFKLETRMIVFESFKSSQDDFERIGGDFTMFEEQKHEKMVFRVSRADF